MTETTTKPPALTAQDIAEAQGALRNVLERVLRDTGATANEFVTMRVITARGPWSARAELAGYLAGQPQLGLDAEAVELLLSGLEERGVISTTGGVTLTGEGAELFARMGTVTRSSTAGLFAGFDPADLDVAHRVLAELTERANALNARS